MLFFFLPCDHNHYLANQRLEPPFVGVIAFMRHLGTKALADASHIMIADIRAGGLQPTKPDHLSPVPKKFAGFPEEMAMRPSQIRAAAAETALMIPAAYSFREAYGHLKVRVVIVAGMEDRVSEAQQSAELHRDIAHSTLRCLPSTGHMVHQTATAEVMSAIDMVTSQKKEAVSATGMTKREKQTLAASVT